MASSKNRLVARLLWLVPAVFLFLTIQQLVTWQSMRRTMLEGEDAVAAVLSYRKTDRVDVSFSEVQLRVVLDDGEVIEDHYALPISLIPQVEGRDSVAVRVRRGAIQDVVIAHIGHAQYRMALINASMSFVGLVMTAFAVFAWNRYLKREGDPAERTLEEEVA